MKKSFKNKMIGAGLNELQKKGFLPKLNPIYDLDDGDCFVAYDEEGNEAGVIAWWVDDLTAVGDATVFLVYVKPEFRCQGVSEYLHEALIGYCKLNNIGLISYAVHNHNKKMLAAQEKRKPVNKYTIFQYEV